jgi:prepilin-type N-terminal cleavage/methylation domain-containing protein
MSRCSCSGAGRRTGVTLIELLVVLAILGVVTGLTGLAFRDVRPSPTPAIALRERIVDARHEAITSGHTVTITVMVDEQPHAVTAFADGRVMSDLPPAPESADRHVLSSMSPGAEP